MATIRKRYGVTDEGKSALHEKIGHQGGKVSRGGGFAYNRELARKAGRIGGLKSKRRKALTEEEKTAIFDRAFNKIDPLR